MGGTLEILHRRLATIVADDKSKTYGDADPALTAVVTGEVAGESLVYSLSRLPGEDVGTYLINATVDGTATVNDNYTILRTPGLLTINPKAVTITADDLAKTYGDADPTLTATVTGAVNGETLDYSLGRDPGEDAGDYDIVVTPGTNPNYTVTVVSGTLTINPKAVTITVDDQTKYDGDRRSDA